MLQCCCCACRSALACQVVFPEPDLKAIYTAFHDGSDDDGVSASEFITWITANTDKPAVASTASDPVFPIPDALVKTLRSKLTAGVCLLLSRHISFSGSFTVFVNLFSQLSAPAELLPLWKHLKRTIRTEQTKSRDEISQLLFAP